jgi:hypothetical protein
MVVMIDAPFLESGSAPLHLLFVPCNGQHCQPSGGKCQNKCYCIGVLRRKLQLLPCRMSSRCFWDDETDQYAFESFKNVSLGINGCEQCTVSA